MAKIIQLQNRTAALERLNTFFSHFKAIVDSSDDAIGSEDLYGIVQTWNKGAERLYGYSAVEMTGRPMSLLLPPDRPDEETLILTRLARGERVDHFETVRRRKDGGYSDCGDVPEEETYLRSAVGHDAQNRHDHHGHRRCRPPAEFVRCPTTYEKAPEPGDP